MPLLRALARIHLEPNAVEKPSRSAVRKLDIACVLACLALSVPALPAFSQAPSAPPDPLAKMRAAAAAASTEICSTTEPSACAVAAPKIIASALGPSPLPENLRRLTDDVGGRVTGSPAMARAIAWAMAAFTDAGITDVHTEKYTIPVTWSEGDSHLEILTDAASFPLRLISAPWSPATPAAGIEADVLDLAAGAADDFARIGPSARGAIVLIHSDPLRTRDDLLAENIRAPGIIDRAVSAGAQAILWMGDRDGLVLYRRMSRRDGTGALEKLPQAIVAREDALHLSRALSAGRKIRVRLRMPNKIGGPLVQENVVAEIRGREKPSEFVLLGAHLDSWDLGTGALDNGCNAALVIEAARDIRLTGLRPRRSIRFVLFSGSEQGMLGSLAYVRAHRAELDQAFAAIIFGPGTARLTGFSLGGRRDLEPGVRESLDPLSSWNISDDTDTHDAPSRSDDFGDAFDFLLEGVPTLVANHAADQPGANAGANDLPNYHAASDTYDKVDILSLKLNTAVAGVLAFSIAEHPEPLGRRLSRPDVAALLAQTGLDSRMKSEGIWPSWEAAQRGRQP